MTNRTTAPVLADDDVIQFFDSHRPALGAGTFRVTMSHDVANHGFHPTRTLEMLVEGARFSLPATDVGAAYPPDGSTGDFEAAVPQLMLGRATLPWTRTARAPDGELHSDDGPPWLALLVFAESELAGVTSVVNAGRLVAQPGSGSVPAIGANVDGFELLEAETGHEAKQPVTVLDLPVELAKAVLPRYDELPYLCTVRHVTTAGGQGTETARAVVMANRTPPAGTRNVAHLVSLEHQYHRSASSGDHQHWSHDQNAGTVRLVSLAQVTFTCTAERADLDTVLRQLDVGPARLSGRRLRRTVRPVGDGSIPLRLARADGTATAAWYHGPLDVNGRDVTLPLPARTANDCLVVEPDTAMIDLSYAAAWELGRLLALREPDVGIVVNQWKRRMSHLARITDQAGGAPEAGVVVPPEPPFPATVWFQEALGLLHRVPFPYLLPEPDLLAPESLVPFVIDRPWLDALFDGAFSIGRTSAAQVAADRDLRAHLPPVDARSGFLLRSVAVSGWPDLIIEGSTGGDALDIVRFDRLAGDTLLVIFDGLVDRIDLHLHPQAIHSGLDGSALTGLSKQGQPVPWHNESRSVLAIGALATTLGATGPSDFATKMIEPVPKVSFLIDRAQTGGLA